MGRRDWFPVALVTVVMLISLVAIVAMVATLRSSDLPSVAPLPDSPSGMVVGAAYLKSDTIPAGYAGPFDPLLNSDTPYVTVSEDGDHYVIKVRSDASSTLAAQYVYSKGYYTIVPLGADRSWRLMNSVESPMFGTNWVKGEATFRISKDTYGASIDAGPQEYFAIFVCRKYTNRANYVCGPVGANDAGSRWTIQSLTMPDAVCVPKTAAEACGTFTCGTVSNGCGGTISCGTCAGCSNTNGGFCELAQCTSGTACGKNTLKPCCTAGERCTNTPQGCVIPISKEVACAGRTCGTVSDGAGGTHTCGAPCISCMNPAFCTTSKPEGAAAFGGQCTAGSGASCYLCIPPLEACGTKCVNTFNDAKNCGECGKACNGVCNGGVCQTTNTCANGVKDASEWGIDCGGPCPTACTACTGTTCPSGMTCKDNVCVCPTGQQKCSDNTCKTIKTDEYNCGSCGNECDLDETCQNGVCNPICASNCQTKDAKKCDGTTGYNICTEVMTGCLRWSSAISCDDNKFCSGNGVCGTTCTANCNTQGAKQCTDAGLKTCQQSAQGCLLWSQAAACPTGQSCVSNQCTGTVCTPTCGVKDAKRCEGATGYQTCTLAADGCLKWTATTACPGTQICSGEGECDTACTNSCGAEGEKRCTDSGYQVCSKIGSCFLWSATQSCPSGQSCTSGNCAATCTSTCATEGATQCGTGGVQTCVKDTAGCKHWSNPVACLDGKTCTGGTCSGTPCTGCTINGVCIPSGAADGTNPCKTCDISKSTTSYSAVTDGTACTGGICQAGVCSTTPPVTTGLMEFRYLRVATTEPGWVAWREIELFAPNGTKITPVAATASCDWCNSGTPASYSGGPTAVYDGTAGLVWNAGETALCSDSQCLSTRLRSAWIVLDLGSVKKVGSFRLQEMGDTTAEVTDVYSSSDGEKYTKITQFKASEDYPFKDSMWLTYPKTATTCVQACGADAPASRCNGKTAQTCTDGCWRDTDVCDSGEYCKDGACNVLVACTSTCTQAQAAASARQCFAAGGDGVAGQYQICSQAQPGCYRWSVPAYCAAGVACSGAGVCGSTSGAGGSSSTPDQCLAGQQTCPSWPGDRVMTCSKPGEFYGYFLEAPYRNCLSGCAATNTLRIVSGMSVDVSTNPFAYCKSDGTAIAPAITGSERFEVCTYYTAPGVEDPSRSSAFYKSQEYAAWARCSPDGTRVQQLVSGKLTKAETTYPTASLCYEYYWMDAVLCNAGCDPVARNCRPSQVSCESLLNHVCSTTVLANAQALPEGVCTSSSRGGTCYRCNNGLTLRLSDGTYKCDNGAGLTTPLQGTDGGSTGSTTCPATITAPCTSATACDATQTCGSQTYYCRSMNNGVSYTWVTAAQAPCTSASCSSTAMCAGKKYYCASDTSTQGNTGVTWRTCANGCSNGACITSGSGTLPPREITALTVSVSHAPEAPITTTPVTFTVQSSSASSSLLVEGRLFVDNGWISDRQGLYTLTAPTQTATFQVPLSPGVHTYYATAMAMGRTTVEDPPRVFGQPYTEKTLCVRNADGSGCGGTSPVSAPQQEGSVL